MRDLEKAIEEAKALIPSAEREKNPARARRLEEILRKLLECFMRLSRLFLVDATPFVVIQDGRAMHDHTDLIAVFATLLDVPGSNPDFERALRAQLRAFAVRSDVPRGRILQLSDTAADGTIFVRVSDRFMVRISRAGSDMVPNGTDGFIIVANDGFADLAMQPSVTPRPLFRDLERFIASTFRFQGLSPDDGALLVCLTMSWALFPRTLAGERAILTCIGKDGARSLVRLLVKILMGAEAEPEVPPERYGRSTLGIILAAGPVVGLTLDDGGSHFVGLLRHFASGAQTSRDRKRSDTRIVTTKPDPRVFVAAPRPPFRPDEAAGGLVLPLRVELCHKAGLPEHALKAAIAAHRGQFFVDALTLLKRVHAFGSLAALCPPILTTGPLQVGVRALAKVTDGTGETFRRAASALNVVESDRDDMALDDNPIVDAIEELLEMPMYVTGPTGLAAFEGTSSELLTRLQDEAASRFARLLSDWTPTKVGLALDRIAEEMERTKGIRITKLERMARRRPWRLEKLVPCDTCNIGWTGPSHLCRGRQEEDASAPTAATHNAEIDWSTYSPD